MQVIRFRRLSEKHWEVAFSERHLFEKLNGEMAEVIAPAKNIFVRMWRKFFPLQEVKGTVVI